MSMLNYKVVKKSCIVRTVFIIIRQNKNDLSLYITLKTHNTFLPYVFFKLQKKSVWEMHTAKSANMLITFL